jgi:probable rRNA maturation factor
MSSPPILLQLDAADWPQFWPDWERDTDRLTAALQQRALPENAFLTAVLTDDAAIQDLNRQFRHKDAPTNVLSFPDGATDPDSGLLYLGDVILALETIAREATEQQKAFPQHAQHMLVHGVLHLLGYTHDAEDDAAEMEQLERQVLATVGIADPYAVAAEC